MDEKSVVNQLKKLEQVKVEMAKVIVGQEQVIDDLLTAVLAGGHCLLEGVPGLAKTLMVSTLSKTLDLNFQRIQFTPDLMPSDIIGTEILEEDHASGKRFFKFQQGPVFTNILLADEINRTPPKTQAALLEAMQEKSVSYAGQTYSLPKPFFVLATQNPVEQSGTYPLPEAQLDRFLMYVEIGYPSDEEEVAILARTTGSYAGDPQCVLDATQLIELQSMVREVAMSEQLLHFVASLVRASRPQYSTCAKVNEFVRWGAGPRAGQALVLCAKSRALLSGRFAVIEDDIRQVANAVLKHRLLLNFQAEAQSVTKTDIVQALFEHVPMPTSPMV